LEKIFRKYVDMNKMFSATKCGVVCWRAFLKNVYTIRWSGKYIILICFFRYL
jgi:hypothetical protein